MLLTCSLQTTYLLFYLESQLLTITSLAFKMPRRNLFCCLRSARIGDEFARKLVDFARHFAVFATKTFFGFSLTFEYCFLALLDCEQKVDVLLHIHLITGFE